ncbi:MAG: hypothetical protein FWE88_09800, partial [Phycisphaerae bacterium]|nr:hypothetical protein [Phycisphaerae bacterium]
WLNRQRVAHLSQPVVYQRGGESVELAATLGATTVDVTDDTGATVRSPQTDFIVSADSLVLGGVLITPRIGDRVHVAHAAGDNGGSVKTLVYEVLSLPDGRHYRPCDPGGRMLRIHAKQVDEVFE